MGEVYRARDSKLGRDVAIKLLPDDLAHTEIDWSASSVKRVCSRSSTMPTSPRFTVWKLATVGTAW